MRASQRHERALTAVPCLTLVWTPL